MTTQHHHQEWWFAASWDVESFSNFRIPASTSTIPLSGILCQMLSRSSYYPFCKLSSSPYRSIRPALTSLITISLFHRRSQYLVRTNYKYHESPCKWILFVIKAYTNRNPQHHSDGANSTKATYSVASRTRKIRKGIVQRTWVQGNKNRAPWRLCYFKLRTTNGNVNNDNLQPYRPPTGSHKPAVNTAGVLVAPLWL